MNILRRRLIQGLVLLAVPITSLSKTVITKRNNNIVDEDPKTIEELISCVRKYTKEGQKHSSPETYALGSFDSPVREKKLITIMWKTFVPIIANKDQTVYWGREPHIEDIGKGEIMIQAKVRFEPYHTIMENKYS